MNPVQGASLQARIREVYDSLTGNETRLADVILAAPGEVATHTAAELSALAGISPASTTRFFRRLRYASYDEARRQARGAQKAGAPLYLQRVEPPLAGLDQLLQAHRDQELANLANSYQSLNVDELPEIAKAMAGARRMAFLGYRHSQPIATMIYRNLLEVRSGLQLLPVAGDTLAEHLCDYGPEDLAVCVGLRRRVPQLGAAMQALTAQGVPVLYIADVMVGKPGKFAKWIIRCHTQGLMQFDSNAAVAAISNLLYSLVAREIASKGNTHPAHVELMHEALKELE